MSNENLKIASEVVGYSYLISWSLCFYAQLYTTYKYKSAEGYSFDFQVFNVLGFTCLSIEYIYNYFYSNIIIEFNDVLFGLHSLSIVMILLCQSFHYPIINNKLSKTGLYGTLSCIFMIIWYYILSLFIKNQIIVFEFIGTIKIIVSVFKYVTQIGFHYKRKLTLGWSKGNTFLDFLGGTLSIVQVIIDVARKNRFDFFKTPLKGTKFVLGIVSMIFDIIIFLQIFVFYRKNDKKEKKKRLLKT